MSDCMHDVKQKACELGICKSTPSPLTREQVEDIGKAIRESNYPWKHHVTYWLETDAAHRLTIKRLEQELAQTKGGGDE